MRKEIQNINSGVGLGNLKFGLSRKQVKDFLGEPDDIDSYSYSDSEMDLTESWHFDELELSMSFDKEDDWRLVTISVSSDYYKFKNFNPIGVSKTDLLSELDKLGIVDLEYEDFATLENPTHELYSSDELGINFWLDDNFVTEVPWSPLFIDDETIDWPI